MYVTDYIPVNIAFTRMTAGLDFHKVNNTYHTSIYLLYISKNEEQRFEQLNHSASPISGG